MCALQSRNCLRTVNDLIIKGRKGVELAPSLKAAQGDWHVLEEQNRESGELVCN
jgi:hypothetical protein